MAASQTHHNPDCDFIRFTWCDTMGIARAKIVPAFSYVNVVKAGIGMQSSSCLFGTESKDTVKQQEPDYFALPYMDSWHLCPWSGSSSNTKVAQVFVQLHQKDTDSTPCEFDTRYICWKLLNRMKKELGFQLYSSFEYEFAVSKEGVPITGGDKAYSPLAMHKFESFQFEVTKRLKTAGVLVESIGLSSGEGQLRVALQPVVGLKSAGNAFTFKQCVKETAIERAMLATFMTNPWLDVRNSGCLNFSLWENSTDNVTEDLSDPDGLSDLTKLWIAGVLKHAGAITALTCHTNNCYNSAGAGGVASSVSYASEHRGCFVRVKRSMSSGTYLQFRGCGAAANPYLVMSAILVAGMDGIKEKIEPPPIGYKEAEKAPRKLKDALDALESNTVFRRALGEDFITRYLRLKKEKDLPLKETEKQFEFYSKLI